MRIGNAKICCINLSYIKIWKYVYVIDKWKLRRDEALEELDTVDIKNRFIIDYEVEYGKRYIDLVMSWI